MRIYTMDNYSEEITQEIIEKVLANLRKNKGYIWFKEVDYYSGFDACLNGYLTRLSNGMLISINWTGDEDYFISNKRVYSNEKCDGFYKWISDYAKRVFKVPEDVMMDDLDGYIEIIYETDEDFDE